MPPTSQCTCSIYLPIYSFSSSTLLGISYHRKLSFLDYRGHTKSPCLSFNGTQTILPASLCANKSRPNKSRPKLGLPKGHLFFLISVFLSLCVSVTLFLYLSLSLSFLFNHNSGRVLTRERLQFNNVFVDFGEKTILRFPIVEKIPTL